VTVSPDHSSRQVAWWPVHEFVATLVSQSNFVTALAQMQPGPLPVAGTPAWCALANGDPRKLLALAVAGEHHVLRMEIAQEQLAEASQAISAAADWSAIARAITARNSPSYIPRKSA
jgi:hypothetical protein